VTHRLAQLCSIALWVHVSGCTGTFDEPRPSSTSGGAAGTSAGSAPAGGAAGSSPTSSGAGTAGRACASGAIDPGPSALRLLSREQYVSTVRELFGDVPGLETALGANNQPSAFGLLQPDLGQAELERFQKAADLIASSTVGDVARLNAIAPCTSADDPRDCARRTVQSFGARAYRAPIDDADDVERHLRLYDAGAGTSHAHGVELLLRGILQAPRFLYRVELGTDVRAGPSAVALSGFELAARLSYTLWDAPPDAALTRAATDGALSTKEGVLEQLARMLQDPRGASLMRRFLERWMHLDDLDGVIKDPVAFPEWNAPSLRASLRDQAGRFFDHVLSAEDGRLVALFGSRTVFMNRELASYYGRSGGDSFEAFEVSDGTASGLLTLPALLALLSKPAESSPIHRGRFVRESLLCQHLPAPPANIPKPPEVDPSVSTRERLGQHEADPACRGCHLLIDPIGFGFEHYDALGRHRTLDGGKPVDARGELVGTRDIDGSFTGVVELGQKLGASAEVEECIARQWFRFVLSRFEQGADACSLERILEAFRDADASLNALPRALVESDAFLFRRPIAAQVTP